MKEVEDKLTPLLNPRSKRISLFAGTQRWLREFVMIEFELPGKRMQQHPWIEIRVKLEDSLAGIFGSKLLPRSGIYSASCRALPFNITALAKKILFDRAEILWNK